MSDDKTLELGFLSGSHLPSDLFTPTLGSNYGMDGYPDMQYNGGVLNAVVDPEHHPAPALPTGLQKGAAGEMDIKDLLMDSALADLKWLDPTPGQDPDRLPKTPELIPELVEAWGVNRRTDGVHVAHGLDLSHVRALEDDEASSKKANSRVMEKIVTHAMRRSIEGQHIGRIIREAAESMGEEMERVVPLLRRVAKDHGLSGNVFIRSSAYPGWGSGKGKEHAKRYAKRARYIVVSDAEMKQATWIQDGRCSYTGKKAVTEVPWAKAYEFYAPRLSATGHKVASGSPRRALQTAFLSQPENRVVQAALPVEHRDGYFDLGSEFRTNFDVEAATTVKAASAQSVDWGADPNGPAIRDLRSVRIASAPDEEGVYSGPVFTASVPVRSEITLSEQNAAIVKAASQGSVPAGEILGLLRKTRTAMSEGMAGKDLTQYLSHRFSDRLLAAADGLVRKARSLHEGLSGHVYVDADAYASDAGVRGCEAGALKHRANRIACVRSMDRCGSCSLARVRGDGTRKCGAYNKTLVDPADVTGGDMLKVQQANITAADMTDAEATASLFAPTYDPAEYNLVNANLEVEIEPQLASTEKLAEVMFDGWVIE